MKEERLQGATLLVLANKQDLVGAATHDEIRQLLKFGWKSVNYQYFVLKLFFRWYKNASLVYWTHFGNKRRGWKTPKVIWMACRRYFFQSFHNELVINYLWTNFSVPPSFLDFFVTCIFDTELNLILHSSVLFSALSQNMNQVTSRNELKEQIKEMRSTNSEIKQKAIIYAILYYQNELHHIV